MHHIQKSLLIKLNMPVDQHLNQKDPKKQFHHILQLGSKEDISNRSI